jgi:hypothetical protein
MKMRLFFLGIVFCIFVVGCASFQEAGKKVWGSSMAHLEEARSSGQSAVVPYEPDAAFEKVQQILKESGAQIYLKDPVKRTLAAMRFSGHVDTTQAGIFLTPQENGQTKIEVASMSPSLVDQVARLLFEALKK